MVAKKEVPLDAEFKNKGLYDITAVGFGHNIVIVPGATMRIPTALHGEVVRQGAIPLKPKEVKLEGQKPVPKEVKEVDAGRRDASLKDVIRAMVVENNLKEWGANGRPKPAVVTEKVGYKVTAAEISKVWDTIRHETV